MELSLKGIFKLLVKMDLIKISSDKEKAKSIVQMTKLIEKRIIIQDKNKMSALILSDYYEIIKELITAILLLDGYKTLSHKDLIDYINEKYQEFNSHEISLLDELRVLRNRIAYEGFLIEPSFLNRNESSFMEMIHKLRRLIEKKLD